MATARENIRRWEVMQVKGHQQEGKSYKETKRSHQSSSLHRLGELRTSCLQSGSLGTEPTMGILVRGLQRNSCQGKGRWGISIGQGKYRTRIWAPCEAGFSPAPRGELVCPVERGQVFTAMSVGHWLCS